MDWWSASVDQFVKIPWDKITMGCHEVNHQIMCYDYKPTNAFYKSIDLPVTMHSSNNESMWVVAGLVFLLIILTTIVLEDSGILR